MFCTQCHIGFCWRSGKITPQIHNPHYFEWLQSRDGFVERDQLDIQCGRELDQNFIWEMRRYRHIISPNILEIIRCIIHIRQVVIPEYLTDGDMERLRVKYLKGDITYDKFKILVQRRDKKIAKYGEISALLSMFVSSATDIFYRFLDICKNNCTPFKIEIELNSLREYVNECLLDISTVYKGVVYNITDLFEYKKTN